MSPILDLGALLATVDIETVQFDRKYVRLVRQFSELGPQAERAAGGTARLDESLAGLADTSTAAATGTERVAKSATQSATAQQRAAVATQRHAAAQREVGAILERTAGLTSREQQAVLRLTAAQERLNAMQEGGAATTRQLATAQATLIGAQRSLVASQEAAAVSSGKFRGALVGSLKTAGELGLVIGGIEIARKGIEFIGAGKQLTDALNSVQAAAQATDAEMKPVRAQVIGLGKDLTVPGATAVDAAHAIDDLVRAGMTLPRAMASARSALLLATVAQTDMAFSSRVLGDTLDEFQLPASKAASVANMLGAAATSTAGGLETVFDAMKYAGTRARTAQIPMDDLLASIVDLSKAGLQGTMIGTGLAMAISKLAAPSGPGAKALRDLGIQAWDATGRFKGMTYVVSQVFEARNRFGSNSKQFLADVSTVFGNRAANAIAAFSGKGVEGLDRFKKRLDTFDLQKAADQMNRGLGAAFRQLGKQATAAGIDIYTKLGPSVVRIVQWLGTTVPAAIRTTMRVLGPLIHDVGTVLAAAWHGAVAVLRVVGSALSGVGHFLSAHRTLVTNVGRAVLVMWATWKGYKIAMAATAAVQGAIEALTMRAMHADGALVGLRSSALGLGVVAAVAVGGYALGRALSSITDHGHQAFTTLGSMKQITAAYRDELQATNGVLNDSIRLSVAKQLQDDGLAAKAAAAGISLGQLTGAITGTDAAMVSLVKQWKAAGSPSDDTITTALLQHKAYAKAAGEAKDLAGAQQDVTAAHKKVAPAATNAAIGVTKVATAEERAAAAAKRLDDALKILSGRLSVRESLDQFRQSVLGMKDQLDKNSHSLQGNSKAAVGNRLALDNAIGSALSYVDALKQQGASAPRVKAALQSQIHWLIAHATQMGLTRKQVETYLDKLHLLPRQIGSAFHLSGVAAALAQLQAIADKLASLHDKTVTVNVHPGGGIQIGGRAGGGYLPRGYASVGEGGPGARPELAYTDATGRSQIISHEQSKAIVAATGMRAPGFAGGTKPDTQAISTAIGNIGSAPAGPQFQVRDVGIARVLATIGHATHVLDEQIARGLSGHAAARYRHEIAALTRLARHELADLRLRIRTSDIDALRRAFRGSVADVRDASKQLILDMRHAGATSAQIARAQADQARLVGEQTQLAAARNRLSTISDYTGSIKGTLAGGFDSTKFGSIGDLEVGLGGQADQNNAFGGELKSLRSRTHDKRLLAFINEQAAQGNTTTLQSLFGASGRELRNVSKDLGAYNQSLSFGADQASLTKYGQTQHGEQAIVNRLNGGQMAIASALHAMAKAIGHGFTIHLNGEKVGHAVVNTAAFASEVEHLASMMHAGRKTYA